ncbi:hypothetical protein CAI21_10045 [Alkalilimnicola ehrlichii]|uniref:Short-chain dehydrogenase n=1 Tax=Alkalilimnicola ehrlichii TaxID=351052 RepID=A0A3E0WY38_9GAMM|nr:SDR family NAD(P)-dependent oxidoreductase [Alkalilimnicola ehrlichii]RFA29392.1 hypothetical protein CAI21_10045 [Alkalilimnicola ehrlichii]RFA36905.1 hypothetical protein CAL65_10375 [Alkalilimnicola ehrlichii]
MSTSSSTVLITGGTSGIGRALVELYLADGWRVITCARSIDALTALERQFSGVIGIPCDLADREERRALLHHVRESTDQLQGLINNAGIQMSYPYEAGTGHTLDIEQEIAINLTAPIDLGHLFGSLLAKQRGFIANITSALAYIPKGRSPLYAGTKAGLSLYTRSIRFQHPGVRFVEIVMPLVDTPLAAERGRDKLSPIEAAKQAQAGIASGRETVWVGKTKFIPFLNRFIPHTLTRLINKADSANVRTQRKEA